MVGPYLTRNGPLPSQTRNEAKPLPLSLGNMSDPPTHDRHRSERHNRDNGGKHAEQILWIPWKVTSNLIRRLKSELSTEKGGHTILKTRGCFPSLPN